MFDDWIDTLFRGNCEVNLPSLVVSGGNAGPFRGGGRLSWQTESGIRVQAETDGGESLMRVFGRAPADLGQLIPHGAFISAAGRTQDGWHASTTPVVTDGYRVASDSPHVVWDFTTHGISLKRATSRMHYRTLRALMGPSPKTYLRPTETVIDNEYFPQRVGIVDWLLAEPAFGVVAVRRRSDDWCEVKVLVKKKPPRDGAWDIFTAIARAFGFIFGRRVIFRGLEDLAPDRDTREIVARDRAPTRNELLTPLGDRLCYRRHVEELLGRAIDFFFTEQGRESRTTFTSAGTQRTTRYRPA